MRVLVLIMMDNLIAFDLCSIIILSVLLFSLVARKMTHGKINGCFIACIVNLLLCAISDFIVIIAPVYFPIKTIINPINKPIPKPISTVTGLTVNLILFSNLLI